MRISILRSIMLGALIACGAAGSIGASTGEKRQVGAVTLENVPEIPSDVRAAAHRYQHFRSATFRDWVADGTMLITTRFGTAAQVHRVDFPGGARTQLTFFDEPVANAWGIPGSNRFVLQSDSGGDEWFQLYTSTQAGPPVPFTEPGTRNLEPVLSKDGRLVAWSRAVKGSTDYWIFTADLSRPSAPRLAHRGEGRIVPADISADKSKLLLSQMISTRETRLSLLDLATGHAIELPWSKEPARYEGARFTPDARGVLAITDHGSDWLQLVEINLSTGERTTLTPNLKWEVEAFDLSDDGRTLAYAVNEDGFSIVRLIDRASRRPLPEPKMPSGVLSGIGFSPDGRQLAISLATPTFANDVWTWDLDRRALTRWTFSEIGPLDPAGLAEPRLVRFHSFDGLSVPAFVYRPKNVPAGAKTPVVIDIHGGPESQARPNRSSFTQMLANELGATVIHPNVRGSEGYGRAYLNLDNGIRREDSVKDIGALLDWIAAQPDLDSAKVAVRGGSYGGYMTLATMIHYGDRLVGGIDLFGISDFNSFFNNTEAYRRNLRRQEFGDERDPAIRAFFQRISPLANIGRIRKPMLVVQGANDPRVPKSESDQVVAGIRANGAEVWYVVAADEGHGFRKKPNSDLTQQVEMLFLKRVFGR